ncbi:hypothetical protein C8R43DRAFT_910611 [Mycena crocata]|nr:hypothetical protein C8R43DRAFT_910611 [Mycena crocata]
MKSPVYKDHGRTECSCDKPALYRCLQCTSPDLCQECIVGAHVSVVFHEIVEWNDGAESFIRSSLRELALHIGLGHGGGTCSNPRPGKLEVVTRTGLCTVAVDFCTCPNAWSNSDQIRAHGWTPFGLNYCTASDMATLDSLRNHCGRCTATGWEKALFRTCGRAFNSLCLGMPFSGVRGRRHLSHIATSRSFFSMPPQDPPKGVGENRLEEDAGGPFVRIAKEIAFLFDAEGIDRYKYFLFLAQDCNFRLINRDISTEACDPVIDNGLGYFVNREQYKKFLQYHVNEEEISTCSGFQAIFLPNAKRIKGLHTTGVAGVMCARHNMWRPNGIGDLQHGECYCNMDFIFFSAILNSIILFLTLSYDIASQYSKNFWTRMDGLPEKMHIDKKKVNVWFKVPNFHILGHKPPCHSPYSFHWMWGAGVTDGEDVEQNWDFTNGAAGSTKMMGLGACTAFLEGLFAFHNWTRMVSYCRIFTQRLAREGKKHKDAFEAFTQLLEAERPELVAKWRKWVRDWEAEQHTEGIGVPYEMKKPVTTMKDIRLQLGKEKLTRMGAGVEVEKHQTSSTFITMGLEIEQTKCILTINIKALSDPSTLQELDFVKRKTVLLKRVKRFRKLQRTYMPNVVTFLTPAQREVFEDTTRDAQAIKLFMPSELSKQRRLQACEKGGLVCGG